MSKITSIHSLIFPSKLYPSKLHVSRWRLTCSVSLPSGKRTVCKLENCHLVRGFYPARKGWFSIVMWKFTRGDTFWFTFWLSQTWQVGRIANYLLVLNVGNGWEWENGMIIDSSSGSFPHSLLSTSKIMDEFPKWKQNHSELRGIPQLLGGYNMVQPLSQPSKSPKNYRLPMPGRLERISLINPNGCCWFTNAMVYPLVNCYITMENHHFLWENPLFLWPFSIATLNYQRVYVPIINPKPSDVRQLSS